MLSDNSMSVIASDQRERGNLDFKLSAFSHQLLDEIASLSLAMTLPKSLLY